MINGSILRKIQQIIMVWLKCKGRKEDVFRPTIGIETLHKSSNDNGVRQICLKMSIVVSSTYYPYKNIHNPIWTSLGGKCIAK